MRSWMQGTLHLQHELKANEAKGRDSGGVYDESAAGRQKITVGNKAFSSNFADTAGNLLTRPHTVGESVSGARPRQFFWNASWAAALRGDAFSQENHVGAVPQRSRNRAARTAGQHDIVVAGDR